MQEAENQQQQPRHNIKNKQLHLKHLEDYMAYASASYGCAMYLFGNEDRFSHCKNLMSKATFCSCCCCLPWSSIRTGRADFIEEDNCCGCQLATIQLKLPHLEEDDIIHLSLKNKFLETPFMVAADRKLEKIVISIRGTLSIGTFKKQNISKNSKNKIFQKIRKTKYFKKFEKQFFSKNSIFF
jgi:hypothetical protein